jgi:acetyltransferase
MTSPDRATHPDTGVLFGRTGVENERRSGLEALFEPRGIAVVGASASPGKLGAAMARSLETFPGQVVLVNARRPDPAAGLHPSVAAAVDATGTPVDLAVLCVPASGTAGALADAAAAGARAALVCAGGFAEAGGSGLAHQADVAAVVAETGLRLLGPNTSGFLAPGRDLVASFVPGAGSIPAGAISVVAGSGGILHALSFLLAGAGLGLHLGVGIGNGLDVTAADVLNHLAAGSSPVTDALCRTRIDKARMSDAEDGRIAGPPGPVALHVEGVTDGRALVEAVERLAAQVPVVALVVGRNDVGDFARSHTGALTPVWRTARAALRAAGAVLVDDEREMVDALVALGTGRPAAHPNPGVGLVTGQAGPAVLFTDRLKTAGVSLPPVGTATAAKLDGLLPSLTHQTNPVDTGRPGETFTDVLAAVGADPAIDLLTVYAILEPGALDLTATVKDAIARFGAGAPPVVVATGGPADAVAAARRTLAHAGVAAYDGVAGAVTGVRALVDDARARAARAAAGSPVRLVVPEAFVLPAGEDEGKRLLTWLGIDTPTRHACDDRADAHAALARLAAPVVVKMLDPVVLHKAAVGGVRLGVRTGAELDAALDALDAAGAHRYLVEETAPPGLDLIVGARRDPVFGPVVLLGLGGDLAEALEMVVVRPAPLSETAAAGMLDELLGPIGGRVGRSALADAITSLGALLAAVAELTEIEINPLRATVDGRLVALDVVIGGASEVGTVEAVRSPALAALVDGQGGH